MPTPQPDPAALARDMRAFTKDWIKGSPPHSMILNASALIESQSREIERLQAVEALEAESWAERESRIGWQTRLNRECKAAREENERLSAMCDGYEKQVLGVVKTSLDALHGRDLEGVDDSYRKGWDESRAALRFGLQAAYPNQAHRPLTAPDHSDGMKSGGEKNP